LSRIPGDGKPWLEEFAFVGQILTWNAHRNWLQTLESRGRFKVSALLAAMQSGVTLRTRPTKVDVRGEHGRTIVAARSCYYLNQPRQTGTGNVQRRARTLRSWPLVAAGISLAGIFGGITTAGILIAVLFILTIAFHRCLVGLLL
jgi:hypothetical protein